MTNNGKKLEKLISRIESLLLGESFSVQTNERVFDEDGNQIAEFDIQIEGRIGSTRFKWLIECRDRVSEGAAPGSWIEQLSGRKKRFNFDKVIAVSTTGFSSSAVNAAKELNILLRQVDNIEDISSHLGTIKFRMVSPTVIHIGPIEIDFTESSDVYPKSAKTDFKVNPMVRPEGVQDFVELREFILSAHRNYETMKTPDRDCIQSLVFLYPGNLELIYDREILKCTRLCTPFTIDFQIRSAKVLSAKSYNESGHVIGEEIALSSEFPDGTWKRSVICTRVDDQVEFILSEDLEFVSRSTEAGIDSQYLDRTELRKKS